MEFDSKKQLNILEENDIIEVKLSQRLIHVELVAHFGRLLQSLVLRII